MTRVAVALNGRFLAQRTTGVQRYARELVRALDEHLTSGRHAIAARLLVPRNAAPDLPLHQIEIRRTGWLRGQVWEQLQLPGGAGADLLVNLGNTAPLALRRQIVTIFDASVWAVPESYARRFALWYRLLLPVTARRARGVMTVSEFSRQELAERMGLAADTIRVVPAGHEHMLRIPADRRVIERWGLGDRPFVVAVSSLAPHKNFAVAARAMTLLGNDVECDLVVAGVANPKVFAAGGEAAVRSKSIGYVTDAELRALYERAACLVYPSRYEGFGLPPLEAMGCGCPVVVARAASLPEVCGDAALYADPESPEQFASAVRRILTQTGLHEELRQLGLARARRFTWAGAAAMLLALVREAAGT